MSSSLERLKDTHDIDIVWHSFELRPQGSPPISPEHRARIEAMRPQFRQTAKERYGIEINSGPFGIDSRPALIGEKYGETQGKGHAYHDAVALAYWEQAQDISDLNILTSIAKSVGLDGDAFLKALDDPKYAQQVDQDVLLARQYGLNGVPALIFGNKYLVSGAQPLDVLKQVVDKIESETNGA